MISKLKQWMRRIDPEYPGPPLEPGESVLRDGTGAKTKGLFGGRWGALTLTDQRLVWYEQQSAWPLKRLVGEIRLSDIASVDKGNPLNFLFGGMCIRIRLNDGSIERLYEGDDKLDEWIAAITSAVAQARESRNCPTC
jgi:hypothetical protein